MTIRRFTTSDGREGATFSDGWSIAREPGTPGADVAVTAEALCEDGTQITWLDAEPAPPAELTEAQRHADIPAAFIAPDEDGELWLVCQRCNGSLDSIEAGGWLGPLVTLARTHACSGGQDGGQAEGGL